jgi:hypothetical protein
MEEGMLTVEQKQAVRQGDAVSVDVDGTPCVLLRQDVYDSVKGRIDDGVDVRGTYAAILRASDQDGPDPHLADYQQYRRKP